MGMEIPGDCARKYKPVKLLGEGGFGRVFRAEQVGLGRPVALKVLHAETLHDEQQKQRFLDEGRITAQLSHPNVVRVIDAGAETGIPWLVYELVEGPSLKDKALRSPLTWREAIRAACSVASALEEAHRHEIVHRDVKAENVLESADGEYKLADFGIAKWSTENGVKTKTGFVVGTPTHLAPELIKGLQPSPASDVYALGVLLYELLTGRLPFDDEHLGKLMQSHLNAPVPTPTRLQPDLPDELDAILQRALEKEPGERIASARELREALERVQVRADAAPAPRRSAVSRRTAVVSTRDAVAPAAAAPGRAAGLAAVAVAVALAALFAYHRAPVGQVVPSRSPSPVAPAIRLVDTPEFRERVTDHHRAILIATQRIGTRAEEVLRALKRANPIGIDFSSITREVAPAVNDGLNRYHQLVGELEEAGAGGPFWLHLASTLEELTRALRHSPRTIPLELNTQLDRVVARARAHRDPDVFQRAYAVQVVAVVGFARGEPRSQKALAEAYAAGYETLRASSPPDPLHDAALQILVRQLYGYGWFTHESRVRSATDRAALVPALRAVLEPGHAAQALIDGDSGAWLANQTAGRAAAATLEAGQFMREHLFPRGEVLTAARDAMVLVAHSTKTDAGAAERKDVDDLRRMITELELDVPPVRAPWERR